MPGADGTPVVRAYVKGAPDVILDRSTYARMPGGRDRALTDDMRAKVIGRERRASPARASACSAFAQREFDPPPSTPPPT